MPAPLLVTIATQRSGTKFLVAALNAGTRLRSFGEAFKPPPPDAPFPAFAARWIADHPGFAFRGTEIAAMLDAFLDSLAARAAAEGRIAHLDIMYNNLGAFGPIWSLPLGAPGSNFLLNWLKARRAAVIHLIRPDLAECYASHVIAEARGIYHTGNDQDAARGMNITLSADQALTYMLPVLRTRRFVQRAFAGYVRHLEVTYPDMVAGQTVAPHVADRIARLAGVPVGDTARLFGASPLRPTAQDKRALVANFDDIARLARSLQRQVLDG